MHNTYDQQEMCDLWEISFLHKKKHGPHKEKVSPQNVHDFFQYQIEKKKNRVKVTMFNKIYLKSVKYPVIKLIIPTKKNTHQNYCRRISSNV